MILATHLTEDIDEIMGIAEGAEDNVIVVRVALILGQQQQAGTPATRTCMLHGLG